MERVESILFEIIFWGFFAFDLFFRLSGKSLGEIISRMSDIREEVLIDYFPPFMTPQMVEFIEIRHFLKEKLSKLQTEREKSSEETFTKKMQKLRFRRTCGFTISSGVDIEFVKPSKIFWKHNSSRRRLLAREVRESVRKNFIKAKTDFVLGQENGQKLTQGGHPHGREANHFLEGERKGCHQVGPLREPEQNPLKKGKQILLAQDKETQQ